MSM
ncbi:0f80af80-7014-44b2-ae63-f8178f1072ce [Thermothielavioides terrestris]|jgi:hypothetical protein